ncbi:hypothetical protein KP509_30G069800 [Ceratopteris richardii]|uniref:TFIIS N-terminal domain-containing protein n=1 Tax=Ceratopteris richardii TaxID=49495 RepID=A0A8T2R5A1_CERRI|nr:hypothetical protein KP509_30G069800 [Ceratopteris richardii]KAH7290932.1 hypothetical protein KP509_30G069800 [Ceratopteris richardii]
MERWRAYFGKANAEIWTVIEQAIKIAAADHPELLREKRGDIAETLFARDLLNRAPNNCGVSSLGVFSGDDGEQVTSAMEEGELKEDLEETAYAGCSIEKPCRLNPYHDEAEPLQGAADQEEVLIEEIGTIKKAFEGSDQSEDILSKLLQRLDSMQITIHALKVTEIGKQVHTLRRHSSKHVRFVAKKLVKQWKSLVKEWAESNENEVEVTTSSPACLADMQSREEPDAEDRLQTLHSPQFDGTPFLPPKESLSSKETKLFGFVNDADTCGQNKRVTENALNYRDHFARGSLQNSSRSQSGSALTYSSDCDVRVTSSQTWELRTPGEMGSATRDNLVSEGMEGSLEPTSRAFSIKCKMEEMENDYGGSPKPSYKIPIKAFDSATLIGSPSKGRVESDTMTIGRPVVEQSHKSDHAGKMMQHGGRNGRSLKSSSDVRRLSDCHSFFKTLMIDNISKSLVIYYLCL